MSVVVELRVLELLSSRLCHELISPVGAINNGIELMDEDDAEFVKDATKLIANSARTAGKRLDFYRFAYGSGRAGTGRVAGMCWLRLRARSPVSWSPPRAIALISCRKCARSFKERRRSPI
jgi:hypothetical protein